MEKLSKERKGWIKKYKIEKEKNTEKNNGKTEVIFEKRK